MSGWSQGATMSTFAAFENPLSRVVNLSGSAAAVNVSTGGGSYTMIPAYYFWGYNSGADPIPSGFAYPPVSITPSRDIYGLVSSNDHSIGVDQTIHYTPPGGNPEGVFQAIWNAIGFDNPTNNDAELDLNCNVNSTDPYSSFCYGQPLKALDCSATGSHNFTNHALVNPGGDGHSDTLYMWNEDILEFMLIK